MTDFYKSLGTVNDDEQNRLGLLQQKFNAAIGKGNDTQTTMINSYISANASRKKCYDECPDGWSTDTSSWKSNVEKDASQTEAGASDGLKDVIASCKAGCDLKWPGIVQNAARTEGVDAGKTIGRYTGTNGKEHDITQCTDLSKYAPKVKMGGLCDANSECESGLCVNWGGRCDDGYIINTALDWLENTGHCGLGMTRIDGGTYSWGNTFNSMCKSNIEQLGMARWPGVTQYMKYQGTWVRLNPDWGYPNAPKIANQRTEDGKYIQDEKTALKACEAYGGYCLGFYTTGDGNFILQSAGGENPKQNWAQFSSELLGLNNTLQEGFGGYSSDPITNKSHAENPELIAAWGKMAYMVEGPGITEKNYSNPTFPIANMRKAMKETCPKSWQKFNGNCRIDNDDVKKSGNIGWNGSSFGCNLSGDRYNTDCKDVANKAYTCWHVGEVPKGKEACRAIRGKDIPSCFASGGRPREVGCPTPAKMIVWIGRPGQNYFATKASLVPALQQLATEFPDVRLTDKSEMDDIIAKNMANCACGWYRTDVFNGTTWKTGFDLLPLTNGYPSNTSSVGGCGGGRQAMIGCGTTTNSWNRGKGGIYVTMSATQEFVMGKLQGLGFTGRIVESHQQLLEKPPPPKKQIWSTGSNRYNRSGWLIYQSPKDKTSNRGTNWNRIPGELTQMSTGQKEVYGVSGSRNIYAHAKDPAKLNANGARGWRRMNGTLTNISASNKDWVFGVNRENNIYQCKKPCKGGWQRISGKGSGEVTVNWGGSHTMGNCNQYTTYVGPYKNSNGQYLADACQTGLEKGGTTYVSDNSLASATCNKAFPGDSSVANWKRIACSTGVQLANAGGGMTQISGGQNYVYGVNKGGDLMRARLPITNPSNPQWYEVNSPSGRLKWVNASNSGYLYATNNNDDIFVCQKPCNGGWKQISGGLENIEADKDTVYGTNRDRTIYSKPMDGMKAIHNWSRWTIGGGSSNVSPEPFVGGKSIREGYAPLEGDMITACNDSGTQGGQKIPGLEPTGDFLVKNRVKEKEAAAKLVSMQKQIKQSINQLQGDSLNVAGAYKNQSLNLLKQLASYENAKAELLKSGRELDTLDALKRDSHLRKNSEGMSYYLWLTLAISVLGFAITKIK